MSCVWINTSLELRSNAKQIFFFFTFSFLIIIEPMKESPNKYVNQWRESLSILSHSLFNTFQNQSSSLIVIKVIIFMLGMGQRLRGGKWPRFPSWFGKLAGIVFIVISSTVISWWPTSRSCSPSKAGVQVLIPWLESYIPNAHELGAQNIKRKVILK